MPRCRRPRAAKVCGVQGQQRGHSSSKKLLWNSLTKWISIGRETPAPWKRYLSPPTSSLICVPRIHFRRAVNARIVWLYLICVEDPERSEIATWPAGRAVNCSLEPVFLSPARDFKSRRPKYSACCWPDAPSIR